MSLRVLEPGLYSLVVDYGRPNWRSLGVPIGGAADRTALSLGNVLLGNTPDAAALEISLSGPTLQAECDVACVVYGAPFVLSCGRPLRTDTTFTLHAGDVFRIGGTPEGMRAYLCVRGGILAPVILGSRSAFQPLRAGDVLGCEPSQIRSRFAWPGWEHGAAEREHDGALRPPMAIRVVEGAQANWVPAEDIYGPGEFGSRVFTVTAASNRMGLRLQGEPVRLPDRELVSEPVCPGVVQATRDGQCIILGVDGQTIGGYPKLAQVIRADLDRLGQLRPGERIYFARVSLEEAEEAYRRQMKDWRRRLLRLQTAEVF